ncbi:MAG: hypothetical protein CVV24_00635 [Ignavibacteriae bacterium HGW-Ignavibacteriae-3]|nr:MAG: hypothetical protein CVV24_00635 [Ignavibacteriae bacterium HGW-Ignavibacteriae-3]
MSVKIDLNSGKIIQQITLELKKIPAPELNKFKLEFMSDIKKISEDSKNLRNVDPNKSNVEVTNTQINFNLIYLAVPLTTFAAGGFINKEEKTIEINFSYEFPREIVRRGSCICKQFLFTLTIKAVYGEASSCSEKIPQEDILKFIQRVVSDIFDRFNDGQKSLRTIILDQKNVEKMINLDSGEISRIVQTLVGAVISFAKFKEMNETNNLKVGVVLSQPGHKNILNGFSVKKVISYEAEIKELDVDSERNLNTIFL